MAIALAAVAAGLDGEVRIWKEIGYIFCTVSFSFLWFDEACTMGQRGQTTYLGDSRAHGEDQINLMRCRSIRVTSDTNDSSTSRVKEKIQRGCERGAKEGRQRENDLQETRKEWVWRQVSVCVRKKDEDKRDGSNFIIYCTPHLTCPFSKLHGSHFRG
jgi:hypothetical protein